MKRIVIFANQHCCALQIMAGCGDLALRSGVAERLKGSRRRALQVDSELPNGHRAQSAVRYKLRRGSAAAPCITGDMERQVIGG